MTPRLQDRHALLTGAGGGIGLAVLEAYLREGARCSVVDLSPQPSVGVLSLGQKHLGRLHYVGADITQPGEIARLVESARACFGTIDILVNNAGTTWGSPAEDYPAEAWHKVINLNVNAIFFLSQYVGKQVMIPKRSGKIINISSIAGLAGNPPGMATIAYNTSKGADINFTRALAAEWGRHNINVNAICPGFFPSKMSAGLLEKFEQKMIAATPLQRLGGDDELMGTVIFLASDASRHVTGQYIAVDGGASCC
jgi:NAD(P)-dependent dehydrogenase (short-subunit alcohol dehydrogenase family)